MIRDAHLERPFFPGRSAPSAGRLAGGIVTSVVAHGAAALLLWFFAALGWIGGTRDESVETDAADVDVVAVSSQEWDRNRVDDPSATPAARSAAKRKEAQNAIKRPPEALPAGQVVDVATGNDEKPADSKYLAEHDNRVAKETRAREQTPFYGTAMPRQTTVQAPDAKAPQSKPKGNQGSGTDDATQSAKTRIAERQIPTAEKPEKASTLERSQNGEARAPDDAKRTAGNSDRLRLTSGGLPSDERQSDAQGRAGTPDAPAPAPSSGVLANAVGAAPNDFLSNLPTSDGTFLNTREFKYAGFFNRVKQRVGEQWRPGDALRRKGSQGQYEPQSRITVVDVVLDSVGRISDIRMSQSCGVQLLDEEAIASFERAQPFLNPPAGLLDGDGHVRFRFGFHVDAEPGNQIPAFRVRPRGRW